MRPTITNIYAIDNLNRLGATYRLCRIRGLSRTSPHYYRNRQLLIIMQRSAHSHIHHIYN